jgi:citrate synthase
MEWKTAITRVEPNRIEVRGYPIAELIQKMTFGQAVFLLLRGEAPSPAQGRMMDAILVATIDHSVTAPSACASRFVASGGTPIQGAVAAGLLAIGSHHGGAIEEAQKMFMDGVEKARAKTIDLGVLATEILENHKSRKMRLPGYGHPYHKKDPRVGALFSLADELSFKGDHSRLSIELEKMSDSVFGRHLQMNADAVMAAIVADMGFDWRMARGFFLISRCAGLVAHSYEEFTRERPFRAVDLNNVKYDGADTRKL